MLCSKKGSPIPVRNTLLLLDLKTDLWQMKKILYMSCIFVSFARPIEFSIAISVSLEELDCDRMCTLKAFCGQRIFPPKCTLSFAVQDGFYVQLTFDKDTYATMPIIYSISSI